MTHNGSYWFDSLAPDDLGLAAEPMPTQVDVAIIGGGYTGLWMAYYLSEYCPDLKVAILEAEVFGFGASGRNGGWCMGTSHDVEALLSQVSTRATGLRLARAMQATVDEIARVADDEQIDCHFEKGPSPDLCICPTLGLDLSVGVAVWTKDTSGTSLFSVVATIAL